MAASHPIRSTNWSAIFILFLAGLVAAMQFAKAAPVMKLLGDDLLLGPVASGLAVSALGIVGVLFAITAGAVVAAIGLKRGLLIALFGGGVMALLGALAPGATSFLASRVAEGFSHLLIVVCAPALMAWHAEPRDKPVALAIWGCFFGLGFAIASVAAPHVIPHAGWRGFFMLHGALMLLTGALAVLVLGRSGYADRRGQLPSLPEIAHAHGQTFRSRGPMLMSLTFCAYTILFLAMLTFLGRFLTEAVGWSRETTGLVLSVASLVTLVFTLLAGVLTRMGLSHFAGTTAALAAVALTSLAIFVFRIEGAALVAALATMMAGFGLLPGFAFASMPRLAPNPAKAALTYGAIAMFGNVGTFTGTPLFAVSHGILGWPGLALCVIVAAALGAGCAFALRHELLHTNE